MEATKRWDFVAFVTGVRLEQRVVDLSSGGSRWRQATAYPLLPISFHWSIPHAQASSNQLSDGEHSRGEMILSTDAASCSVSCASNGHHRNCAAHHDIHCAAWFVIRFYLGIARRNVKTDVRGLIPSKRDDLFVLTEGHDRPPFDSSPVQDWVVLVGS